MCTQFSTLSLYDAFDNDDSQSNPIPIQTIPVQSQGKHCKKYIADNYVQTQVHKWQEATISPGI